MSKSQMLRVLVNQRLSVAAEEIFALFERTILEYEEELCRSIEENQRKQRLLDTALSPTALPHTAATRAHISPPSPCPAPDAAPCPGPSRTQEVISEIIHIKEESEEEPLEQSVKQEEDLPVPVPEFSAFCVKTEDVPIPHQRQTEHGEEVQEDDVILESRFRSEAQTHSEISQDTDHEDDWAAPFSCSFVQTETQPAEELYHKVQTNANANDGYLSETHLRTERKKYQCFVCHKRFESKIILQIHIRVHTGEKPYSCPICKKAFAQKNNLNAHRITHTGEKPYSCSLCKKTFGRRCTLKRHMKIHTTENPSPANDVFVHQNSLGYLCN